MIDTTPQGGLLDRLHAHRPSDEQLELLWSATDRASMLARISERAVTRVEVRSTRRRRVAYRLAAASVAAAVGIGVFAVAGPRASLPTASASPLQLLAQQAGAAARAGDSVGGYVYVRSSYRQVAHGSAGGGMIYPTESSQQEQWTGADGRRWTLVTFGDGSTRLVARCAADQADPTVVGTVAWVDALPHDPDALLTQLRTHWTTQLGPKATAKGTVDEQVFSTLGDVLRPGTADPATRVAAIGAMEKLDGVTTTTVVVAGNDALEVRFAAPGGRPGVTQRLLFDPATSTLTQSEWKGPDVDLTSGFTRETQTASLPASVSSATVVCNDENGTEVGAGVTAGDMKP